MRAALPNHNALNQSSASPTEASLSAVDGESLLESAVAAVGSHVVVDARTTVGDRLPQCSSNRSKECVDFLVAQALRRPGGVDLRHVQRLVGINISHAGKRRLVQEQTLDRDTSTPQSGLESCTGYRQRIRTQPIQTRIAAISSDPRDLAKLATISKVQLLTAVIERQAKVRMPIRFESSRLLAPRLWASRLIVQTRTQCTA